MTVREIRNIALTVAAACCVASISAVSANSAEDPPKPVVTDEGASGPDDRPSKLEPFKREILLLGQSRPGSGYAYLRVDQDAERIDVWWRGPIDEDIRRVIEAARQAGVTVEEHAAVRSAAEMNERSRRFADNPRLKGDQIRITRVWAEPDQSGFHIHYSTPRTDKEQAGQRARQIAQEESGVPILTAEERGGPKPVATRPADIPSWWGGSFMDSDATGSPICSTGFAVERTSGTNISRMLTAYHCDGENTQGAPSNWRTYDGNRLMFNDQQVYRYQIYNQDSLLLDPAVDGEETAGRIYTGGIDSNTSEAIVGYTLNADEEMIRVGGANSGERFARIKLIGVSGFCFDSSVYWCEEGLVFQEENDQNFAIAGGDSGGPVFTHVPGTDPGSHARGIISGGYTTVTCPITLQDPEPCYSDGIFYGIWRIMDRYSAAGKPIKLKTATPP